MAGFLLTLKWLKKNKGKVNCQMFAIGIFFGPLKLASTYRSSHAFSKQEKREVMKAYASRTARVAAR